jgi:hypothetical protein
MFSLFWVVVFGFMNGYTDVPFAAQILVHLPFLMIDIELGWWLYKRYWKVY